MSDFDFDQWAALAAEDPAEFDRRRRQLLDDELARIPEPHQSRARAALAHAEVSQCFAVSTEERLGRAQRAMLQSLERLTTACVQLHGELGRWQRECAAHEALR